jgi:hypothetical protein
MFALSEDEYQILSEIAWRPVVPVLRFGRPLSAVDLADALRPGSPEYETNVFRTALVESDAALSAPLYSRQRIRKPIRTRNRPTLIVSRQRMEREIFGERKAVR